MCVFHPRGSAFNGVKERWKTPNRQLDEEVAGRTCAHLSSDSKQRNSCNISFKFCAHFATTCFLWGSDMLDFVKFFGSCVESWWSEGGNASAFFSVFAFLFFMCFFFSRMYCQVSWFQIFRLNFSQSYFWQLDKGWPHPHPEVCLLWAATMWAGTPGWWKKAFLLKK